MRFTGWNMFLALLIADVVGGVMALMGLPMNIGWITGTIVFVVVAIVLAVGSYKSAKSKKREDEAAAKIAELQDQVAGRDKDGASV